MRLYDLAEQYNDLLDIIRDGGEDDAIQDMIDGLEGVIDDKVESIIKVIKMLEGDSNMIGDEVKRLQDRKSSIDNNRKRLIESTQQILEGAGLDKVKGKLFNIWLQNNPPRLNVIDDFLIPQKYYKTPEPVLQKREIMDAIKNGDVVPGVEVVQDRGLRVR